jgi:membrane protease YdiL (CAAX protease family)
MTQARSRRGSRGAFEVRSNLFTSIVLVFPLLIIYELGVLFTDVMNGADLLTQTLLNLLGVRYFVILQIGLLALLVAFIFFLRQRQHFELRVFIPVLLESGIYALTMGTLIVFLMTDLLHIDPRLAAGAAQSKFIDRFILSIGAGVHEEFLFRLLILGGLSAAGQSLLKLRKFVAVALAFLISSALFSAAHHIGPLGEPLRAGVFVYRMIAGLVFGALFQFRGFAIAVYTHALYDIYVLLLH